MRLMDPSFRVVLDEGGQSGLLTAIVPIGALFSRVLHAPGGRLGDGLTCVLSPLARLGDGRCTFPLCEGEHLCFIRPPWHEDPVMAAAYDEWCWGCLSQEDNFEALLKKGAALNQAYVALGPQAAARLEVRASRLELTDLQKRLEAFYNPRKETP